MIKKLFFLACLLLIKFSVFAQDEKVEMADGFRRNGKIYVVIAVILTIFGGIILYLIRLDRKISRIEKDTNINNS